VRRRHKGQFAALDADAPTWTYPALFGRSVLVKDEVALALWRID
jgi:hypothetical protein